MQLVKSTYRIRCEMGACRNCADYSIVMDRAGIRSRIHICKECMLELHAIIGEIIKKKKSPKIKLSTDSAASTVEKEECSVAAAEHDKTTGEGCPSV